MTFLELMGATFLLLLLIGAIVICVGIRAAIRDADGPQRDLRRYQREESRGVRTVEIRDWEMN